jgi:hypothetical protein
MAAPQRMQTGVFWTLPLDMMHSEIRFPLLPIMLQTVTNPADHGLDSVLSMILSENRFPLFGIML